jgi:hypothetical protein
MTQAVSNNPANPAQHQQEPAQSASAPAALPDHGEVPAGEANNGGGPNAGDRGVGARKAHFSQGQANPDERQATRETAEPAYVQRSGPGNCQAEIEGETQASTASAAGAPSRSDTSNTKADVESAGTLEGPPAVPFHPLANILPMLGEASLAELTRDIGERGLLEPIVRYEGKILDGRCRYRACQVSGIEPRYEDYGGADPLGVVLSLNVHRRHLTDAQRALVGARLCNLPLGANQYSEGMPAGTAAQALGVGVRSIQRAKNILARGIPELGKAVEDGTITLSAAEHISLFSESDQRARLRARGLPISSSGAAILSPSLIPNGPPPDPYNAAPSEQVDGPSETATMVDASDGNQPEPESTSGSLEVALNTTSEAGVESPDPRYREWIWHGYIPASAVTTIVGSMNAPTMLVALAALKSATGQVFWLSPNPTACATTLRPLFGFELGFFQRIHFLEGRKGDFGLPIHDLGRALKQLDHELAMSSEVRTVIIDYLFPYFVPGELEASVHVLRPVFSVAHKIAVSRGVGIIVPCQLPCQGGSRVMTKAVDQLAAIPDLDALLLVTGTDNGTVQVKRRVGGGKLSAVDFRINRSGHFGGPTSPIVLLPNGVASGLECGDGTRRHSRRRKPGRRKFKRGGLLAR